MLKTYDRQLNAQALAIAQAHNIRAHEGVYVALPGPNLETPAEYQFLHRIGGDLVGMSTVPEVIVANHMSMKVAAVSVITDMCDPDNLKAVDIRDILENAAVAEKDLILIFNPF